MPLALAFIATLLLVAAFRNTYQQLFAQLGQDLPGFAIWLGAIIAIGLIGYIPRLEPISKMLLALVFVVIVLKNKGAFQNFRTAFTGPVPTAAEPPAAQAPLGAIPIQFTGPNGPSLTPSSGGGGAGFNPTNFVNPTGGLL